jgi:hypothetical protein
MGQEALVVRLNFVFFTDSFSELYGQRMYYKQLFSRNGRALNIRCTILGRICSEKNHKLNVHTTGNFTANLIEKTILTYGETP